MSQLFKANKLLAGLPGPEIGRMSAHLKHVVTPRGYSAIRRHRPFSHVYFPISGLISIVGHSGNHDIELGIVGNEGFVGIPALLGVDTTPYDAYSQIAGEAFQLPVAIFATMLAESSTLRPYLDRYIYAFQVQLSETAISHGVQKIDNRLARWLLMCHDREEGRSLAIPHEFLAMMLGVRRAGVTTALEKLRTAGYVSTQRGMISIIDREALIKLAGSTYGVAESEYSRVMGTRDAAV